MLDVGTAWRRSGHERFACTERHPPDGNIAVQAACKAKAGMRDLYRETPMTMPPPPRSRMKARGSPQATACAAASFPL